MEMKTNASSTASAWGIKRCIYPCEVSTKIAYGGSKLQLSLYKLHKKVQQLFLYLMVTKFILVLLSKNISKIRYSKSCLLYVTGHGILGLMEVLVEIWVFTFFESLICLKYTGKILDLLSKISQSYECFNDVAFYEIVGRIYYTCSHKYFNAQVIQCTYVTNY